MAATTPRWTRRRERVEVPNGLRDIGLFAWICSRVGGYFMGGGHINAVDTFAQDRRLFRGYMRFVQHVVPRSALPRREVELVTMRTAWNVGAHYEWQHHVTISQRARLTLEDIERITKGPDAPGWTRREELLLRAADEIHDHHMVDEETFDELAGFLTNRQLVSMCFLVGHYQMIAACLKTFGVDMEETAWRRGPLASRRRTFADDGEGTT